MPTYTPINITKLATLISTMFALVLIFILTIKPWVATANDSVNVVFSNSSPITISTNAIAPTPASLYPSTVNVAGMTGTTTKITVTLTGLTHTRTPDMDMLLVSPTGTKFMIVSDTGHATIPVSNLTITLDDSAPSLLPVVSQPLVSGTFRPSSYSGSGTESFPAPAPAPPYNLAPSEGSVTFAVFNGSDPNGTWSLYVVDDTVLQSGSISGGWSMSVTTSGTAATSFSNSSAINLNDIATIYTAATPYPTTIDVSGQTGVISSLKVTVAGLSHTRPQDVDILLVSPNGTRLTLMSDAGSASTSNATFTFEEGAPGFVPNSGALVSGTYRVTNYGGNDNATGDNFPAPAPATVASTNLTALSQFYGYSPNGTWSLYVVDDQEGESGTIAGGWSLDITTSPYVPPTIGCVVPVFTISNSLAVGSSPTGIAAGDFNNDSKQDLVTTNQGANNVSVALGDGLGGFGAATSFAVQSNPYSVAVGNFNADVNLDLVVVNSGSNNVSLLLGDGLGGFSASTNFIVGISPISVAVGDFNNDLKKDVAVANFGGFFAGTVSILLGNGLGGFGPATSVGVRTQPSFVAIGDFNNDTNHDLAVSNFGSNNVSILLGVGNGTFTSAPNASVGTGPVSIAVADYNADGNADMVVANYNSDNIWLRLGNGTGAFPSATNLSAGTNPISVVATDFNSDSRIDVAIANSGSNNVIVYYNGPSGLPAQFGTGTFTVGTGPNAIVAGDFNGDSTSDLATANASTNNVTVLLSSCAVAKGNRFDFNGDRKADFAVFRPSNTTWYNMQTFDFTIFGAATDIIVPEDYTGDGKAEIGVFRPSTATWIVPGVYNLSFGLTGDIPMPADYDGDARADIGVFRPSTGVWYIRRSIDNQWMSIPFGMDGDRPVARDYDGDEKADVAVFRPSTGAWYILQSSDGQVRGLGFGTTGDRAVPADYDGDGKADVAVFRPADGVWYILKSSDNSFFALAWGISTDIPAPGDFDGDGKFDVTIFRPGTGYWYVFRSIDNTLQAVPWGTNGDVPLESAYVTAP